MGLMKIFDTVVEGPVEEVLEDWIDYNGHMNVAYYTLAFDRAIDLFLENTLGIVTFPPKSAIFDKSSKKQLYFRKKKKVRITPTGAPLGFII